MQSLRIFCLSVLAKLGLPTEESVLWTDTVIETSLRGIDSHGILILPMYVEMVEAGGIRLDTWLETISDTGPTLVLDGHDGIGQIIADRAMSLAIERARQFGISFVAVRNSNHFGAAAYFAMKALDHNMIGLAFTNSGPQLAAWGGRTPDGRPEGAVCWRRAAAVWQA